MKIKPTARFITEQVDECGEAIILIGTRKLKVQLVPVQLRNTKFMVNALQNIHF